MALTNKTHTIIKRNIRDDKLTMPSAVSKLSNAGHGEVVHAMLHGAEGKPKNRCLGEESTLARGL